MSDTVRPLAKTRRPRMGTTMLKIYTMEAILLVIVVVLVVFAPGFATLGNFFNVLRTVSMLGIIAFGMTAVIIAGEIDLSVGAAVALAGCVVAWFSGALSTRIGSVAAVAIGVLVAMTLGFLTGVFTGSMRRWFNVPTFITTLALFTALRGAANLITGGFPLTDLPDWFGFLGAGDLFGVPFPVYVFLTVFVLMHLLMKFTSFGRAVYAVGGNAEAARLSGIDVFFVKTMTLAITGVLAAVTGTLIASQIGSGTGNTATGMELDVIAATIIGGHQPVRRQGPRLGHLAGRAAARLHHQRHDAARCLRILAIRRARRHHPGCGSPEPGA